MNGKKLFLLVAVLTSGVVSAGCRAEGKTASVAGEGAAGTARPLDVEVYAVETDPVAGERLIPAVISVEGAAAVLARRDGTLVWLGGEEGMPVEKGQVMARLDDDESRAQLRQAELDVSRMKVEERQYEALLEVNRAEYGRQGALFQDGLISRSALEQAKYKYDGSKQELEKTRLATQISQAKVQAARMEIERAAIRAPFDGQITRREAKLGAGILRGDKLFEVSQRGPLEVRFQIPAAEKGRMGGGGLLDLSLPEGGRVVARARVRRVTPVIDAASNSLGYVADVIGGDGLIPGLTVYIRLPRSEVAGTLLVPRAAFPAESHPARGESSMIFVLNGKTCAARIVQVAEVEGDQVGISAGLAVNDQVILAPPAELRAGDAVNVINQAHGM